MIDVYTNGNITKGLKAQEIPQTEERIYLYNYGDSEINMTDGWESDGYVVPDELSTPGTNKVIIPGINTGNSYEAGAIQIESPGLGHRECVLIGTQVPIPTRAKRFLVIEAYLDLYSGNIEQAQNDLDVVLATNKNFSQGNRRYYHLSFDEQMLRFYIDLTEIEWNQVYVVVGGCIQFSTWDSDINLHIVRIYLTNEKSKAIRPLYNRGADYSQYSFGQDYGTLVGWQGHEQALGETTTYVPPVFDTGYIEVASTSNDACRAETIRKVETKKIRKLCAYVEVTELPTEGNPELRLEWGSSLTAMVSQNVEVSATGKMVIELTHTEMYVGWNGTEAYIGIETRGGLEAKVYAVWTEQ